MPFSDFHGNAETVHRLRDMLARKHFPHALILAGGRGSGKYTLALMLAQALNCLTPTTTDGLPDFCGKCANCTRIAQSDCAAYNPVSWHFARSIYRLTVLLRCKRHIGSIHFVADPCGKPGWALISSTWLT